jgi:hypothetical protein
MHVNIYINIRSGDGWEIQGGIRNRLWADDDRDTGWEEKVLVLVEIE